MQYGNILENFDFTRGLRHDIMTSHTDGDVIEYFALTMMPKMTLQLTTIQNMGKLKKRLKTLPWQPGLSKVLEMWINLSDSLRLLFAEDFKFLRV